MKIKQIVEDIPVSVISVSYVLWRRVCQRPADSFGKLGDVIDACVVCVCYAAASMHVIIV